MNFNGLKKDYRLNRVEKGMGSKKLTLNITFVLLWKNTDL
jgi:hypothetical protein